MKFIHFESPPNRTGPQSISPQSAHIGGWGVFRTKVLSENSADISKSDNHHRDSHHDETKTQGNLIQLVVAIWHGF